MDPFIATPPRRPPGRWRRGIFAAAVVLPFTGTQIWALLVLLRLAPLDGLVGQAFVLMLAGSVAAVWAGWRWTWRLGSERRPKPELPEIPTRAGARF